MKFFPNHYSIKARLILLAAIGLAGFSVILLGNFSFFEKATSQLSRLHGADLRTVQIANELQVGLADINRQFEKTVIDMDWAGLGEANQLAADQKQQIRQLGALNEELREQSEKLLLAFNGFVVEYNHYIEGVINGDFNDAARQNIIAPLRAKRDAYEQMLRATSRNISSDFGAGLKSLHESSKDIAQQQFFAAALLFLVFALGVIWFIRMITTAVEYIVGMAGRIAEGNLDVTVGVGGAEEIRRLFGALEVMRKRLKEQSMESAIRQKRQHQIAQLNDVLRGEKAVQALGDAILHCMSDLLGSLVGAFYVYENDELVLKSTYAYVHRRGIRNRFALGESLVGQAALEQKMMVVENLPSHYVPVASGLGEALPGQVLLAPLVLNGRLLGVLELMTFKPFDADGLELVRRGSEGMAIALHSAVSRLELSRALEQTRRQAEALQQQQEELRATNEELEEQAEVLRASEESLQQQQEELRVMNEELAERNRQLDRQKEEIARSNVALEHSRQDLQEKARQLELSGRYKSEFLSTMSHELRTPLNSILILSQELANNKQSNLQPKQIEHAHVIHSSGQDLLMLINDILDLSKVEEGKLELLPEAVSLHALASILEAQFAAQADVKKLRFLVQVDENLPPSFVLDEQRTLQILRNFLSNAFKFTQAGEVKLHIHKPNQATTIADSIVFSVQDTGVGIAPDKQQLIFDAFRQGDGTISRKYGGTGLGLTISRKLAGLMGGQIEVISPGENQGATFNLILPALSGHAETALPESASPEMAAPEQDSAILIVEDDREFSRILQNLAEEYGYPSVCVHTAADAYAYLKNHKPVSIIMDLGLPDAPGEQLLAHLQSSPQTADVPVHIISGDLSVRQGDLPGAKELIAKPFDRDRLDRLFADIGREFRPQAKNGVLIVEDDPVQREQLQARFDRAGIPYGVALNGEQAMALMQQQAWGIVILDLDLPDCDGSELLEKLGKIKHENTHIIIYTAQDISKQQGIALRRYADRIVLKTDQSITRLLNEATLFLDWLQQDKKIPTKADSGEVQPALQSGSRVLLVDDDIRNLYSLSSVLEEVGLEVVTAGTGAEALEILQQEEHFDLVLMDIMMPTMDGYEAMKRIRAYKCWKTIPIIALTAKAMWDDRAHCIEAGANDYLAKPVDVGKLKAMIKLWLRR